VKAMSRLRPGVPARHRGETEFVEPAPEELRKGPRSRPLWRRAGRVSSNETLKKKRPHFWGHSLKEAKGRKSGKAMQGTNPAAGSALSEKSRTESEGQARPLFLP
jgi:hypothetical protein